MLLLSISRCGELARARASPAAIWLMSGIETSLFCQATGEAELGSTAGEGCLQALKRWAALACLDLMLVMGMLCPVERLELCPMAGARVPAPTEGHIIPLLYPFIFLCLCMKYCTNWFSLHPLHAQGCVGGLGHFGQGMEPP